MPLISIIMPCYNNAKYLSIAVKSLINQTQENWELIIVNDGSTDKSELIAKNLASLDQRIRVTSKTNGGYVSARLLGYQLASQSKYVIFYDADDKLHPQMLERLSEVMEKADDIGAAYCNHLVMDEYDNIKETGIDMPRFIPTRLWVHQLTEDDPVTPFISIFCWTKMIEPMTLIRREAYDQTPGWDIDFGKGHGNIGEGVYLFAEIALSWKIYYVKEPLYYYRRHSEQISAIPQKKMQKQANKVIQKWKERIKKEKALANILHPAIIFMRYRLGAKRRLGSLPHQLRYSPLTGMKTFFYFIIEYVASLPLVFSYNRLIR